MEIHKPKAAHSFREFLIEIGTIICGILIALGLEQVVSTLEWNRKVAEPREAVGLELAENLGKMENRLQLEQCLERRLDAIASIVDHAANTGSLPPLPTPIGAPYTTWGNGVWGTAVSAQTASPYPRMNCATTVGSMRFLSALRAANCKRKQLGQRCLNLRAPVVHSIRTTRGPIAELSVKLER